MLKLFQTCEVLRELRASSDLPLACSFIDGCWVRGHGEWAELYNPADLSQTVGMVEFADGCEVESAVMAATAAWDGWRAVSPLDRIKILRATLGRLDRCRQQIAEVITAENGKTIDESLAEVDGSLREGIYQLDLLAENAPDEEDKVLETETRYEPLGVALLITPYNFPLATIVRKLIPALALGNTAVVKPSEFTPLTAAAIFGLLQMSGLPDGVANLLLGEGPVVGPVVAAHKGLHAISLTGSTETGLAIQAISSPHVRFQAEMGGSNCVVVLVDADLDEAVDAVVRGGFACSGQWCTGTSRVIVDRQIYAHFTNKLVERAQRIVVGNGMDERSDMGPLTTATQLKRVDRMVQEATDQGARLCCGGCRPEPSRLNGSSSGHFFEPTVLIGVDPEMRIAQEEVFGPVLLVMPANDPDQALQLANATRYGLSCSVYTGNVDQAERFICGLGAGMCHVNLPTSYRDPDLPLNGWGDSGRGIPESGRHAREFFSRIKAIYRHRRA